MTASGKINTVSLERGTRIMVTPNQALEGVAQPARTKKKNAIPMTVYNVEAKLVGQRQRRAYDVSGVSDSGDELKVPNTAGNQTFWLAGPVQGAWA